MALFVEKMVFLLRAVPMTITRRLHVGEYHGRVDLGVKPCLLRRS